MTEAPLLCETCDEGRVTPIVLPILGRLLVICWSACFQEARKSTAVVLNPPNTAALDTVPHGATPAIALVCSYYE